MEGVKFSSWVRGPVLKEVRLERVLDIVSCLWEGGRRHRREKGVVRNLTHAITPSFYLGGK